MKYRILGYLLVATLASCLKNRPHVEDKISMDRLSTLDIKLGETAQGDWLDVHHESGQTFYSYVKSDPVLLDNERNKIYLQPLGKFSPLQSHVVDLTKEYLNIFYSLDVVVLPALSDSIVPDSLRRFQGTDVEQLLTSVILDYLYNNIPGDAMVIMAITSKDLYPPSGYNFVFGQARIKQRVGVSSIYRFSNAPMDSSNYHQCLERLIKTSSHEIGHMLSCQHCTHAVCVMNGSNSLWESDSRPNRVCSECHRKFQWNIGFDVQERLRKLETYFAKQGLERDRALAEQDLKALLCP